MRMLIVWVGIAAIAWIGLDPPMTQWGTGYPSRRYGSYSDSLEINIPTESRVDTGRLLGHLAIVIAVTGGLLWSEPWLRTHFWPSIRAKRKTIVRGFAVGMVLFGLVAALCVWDGQYTTPVVNGPANGAAGQPKHDIFDGVAEQQDIHHPAISQPLQSAGSKEEGDTTREQARAELRRREAVKQDLICVKNRWNDANVKGDTASLVQILADDFTSTDSRGIVRTKKLAIANLQSGDVKYTTLVSDDYDVRVYGTAAVVTGRTGFKGRYRGETLSGQYRWTDAWIRRDGRWQCLATQSSNIVDK